MKANKPGGKRDEAMGNPDLQKEVERFKREESRIRAVLDTIEKAKSGPLNRIMDIGFILALAFLFIARFVFNWVDNILSLELGLLLISIKIVWLIKMQSHYNHFIFMIMHTIDQSQREIMEKMDRWEKPGTE